MPFKKGSQGRPVGTKNTKTKQWEALSESVIEKHSGEFNSLMNELWNGSLSDKLKAADLFLQVLKYFKPKLSSVEASQDNETTINVIRFVDAKQSD
jgi:hypothetical protein